MTIVKFDDTWNWQSIFEAVAFFALVIGGFQKLSRLETKVNIIFDWFQANIIGHGNKDDFDIIKKFHGGK